MSIIRDIRQLMFTIKKAYYNLQSKEKMEYITSWDQATQL
jgi:hypothetical protein